MTKSLVAALEEVSKMIAEKISERDVLNAKIAELQCTERSLKNLLKLEAA